ncbi:MAG: hypothetical protein J6W76_01225, partial [Spirochaetales bacterium]|nr:hypothetical protein [Spirochaetales bacterium]
LQTQIDNSSNGSVLDLSECKNLESGDLTINKAVTVRNLDNKNINLSIESVDVTLTGMNIGNVNTQHSGSSGLKIANSSLNSLNLNGNGINASMIQGRSISSPNISLVNSKVTVEVQFNEAVTLELANFAANVADFTGSAAATIDYISSALSDAEKSTFTNHNCIFRTKDINMYEYMNKYGPAGEWLKMKSKQFPSEAVDCVRQIVTEIKSDAPYFPSPSISSDLTVDYVYMMLDSKEIIDKFNLGRYGSVFNFKTVTVYMPKRSGFSPTTYKGSLRDSFNCDDDDDEYMYSNIKEFEERVESASERPFTMLRTLKNIMNTTIYMLMVKVDESPQTIEGSEDGEEYYSLNYIGMVMSLRNAFNLAIGEMGSGLNGLLPECSGNRGSNGLFQ